ncbi:three-Cys-motif partner protein TcmP [Belliella pelovolcani]|uniref:Three-Cys-motif partner protein n=1 Tax=Belliella pelovolcani TaxID=529505 RepID=A0A1N7Q3R6_9BACT|nr:three-Cys-motif partner protein TcmP [Belliella pelovolcani]SIT17494.1 three-Cys-motif partner protein [Belliella pelovolcani]
MKDSQTTMYDHSEIKVRLLDTYIQKYLNILSRAPHISKVHLYDLFCGEGIYENGGEGSPIIFLKAIKNVFYRNQHQGQKTIPVDCVFNDIKTSKTEKLKRIIEEKKLHYPSFGDLRFRNINYTEAIPKVIRQISRLKNEKAFVFIDPYGYKEVRASHIKSILDTKRAEVLLFLPTQFMFRFERKGAPEALLTFIEDLVPKGMWPNSHTGIDFIENLKSIFREYLGEDHFVDTFIITREKNQYFCLFFFTSHIYGFDKMLEAKWELDAEEGRGHSIVQPEALPLFSDPSIKINNKLESFLLEFLEEPRTNGEIYKAILHLGFKPKHAVDVLKTLYSSSRISVTPIGRIKIKKGAFYINYSEFSENPNKVSIQLK